MEKGERPWGSWITIKEKKNSIIKIEKINNISNRIISGIKSLKK